jgi:hypothetical protein
MSDNSTLEEMQELLDSLGDSGVLVYANQPGSPLIFPSARLMAISEVDGGVQVTAPARGGFVWSDVILQTRKTSFGYVLLGKDNWTEVRAADPKAKVTALLKEDRQDRWNDAYLDQARKEMAA